MNVRSARGWKGEREMEGYERRETGMMAEGGEGEGVGGGGSAMS